MLFHIIMIPPVIFIGTVLAAIYLLPVLRILRMFVRSGRKLARSFTD